MTKRRQNWLGRRRYAPKWFEYPDMEGIMDTSVIWKLQTVGHLTNAFKHLKRASVLGSQLAASPRNQGLRMTVEQT